MDETAAPWRALESGSGGSPGPDPQPLATTIPARHAATAVAIAVAGLLGLAAVWLAAGSTRGSVIVDGDRSAPAVRGSAAADGQPASG